MEATYIVVFVSLTFRVALSNNNQPSAVRGCVVGDTHMLLTTAVTWGTDIQRLEKFFTSQMFTL